MVIVVIEHFQGAVHIFIHPIHLRGRSRYDSQVTVAETKAQRGCIIYSRLHTWSEVRLDSRAHTPTQEEVFENCNG